MVSKDLKVIVPHTYKNKKYSLPKIDTQVVCLLLQTGQEEGFVIGATYNEADTVPIVDENAHMFEFEDGTFIKYNTETHVLDLDVKGDINISATENIRMKAPKIHLN